MNQQENAPAEAIPPPRPPDRITEQQSATLAVRLMRLFPSTDAAQAAVLADRFRPFEYDDVLASIDHHYAASKDGFVIGALLFAEIRRRDERRRVHAETVEQHRRETARWYVGKPAHVVAEWLPIDRMLDAMDDVALADQKAAVLADNPFLRKQLEGADPRRSNTLRALIYTRLTGKTVKDLARDARA